MAYAFRPVRTKRLPGGRVRRSRAGKWYAAFYDPAAGKWKRKSGYTDKAATEALARRLESEAARRHEGLIPRGDRHARTPLAELLAEWRQHLLDKGDTAQHARDQHRQCVAAAEACGWGRMADLDATAAQRWLARRREADAATRGERKRPRFSAATSNNYLRALKGFSRWLVRHRGLAADPMAGLSLLNVKADRRHVRRVLRPDQFDLFLTATHDGPRYQNSLTGLQRYGLYLTAAYTGLRSGELAGLTPHHLDLDAPQPRIYLPAREDKARRGAEQPVHDALVPVLRGLAAGLDPHAPLWPGRWAKGETVRMLRADLVRAGIPYRDDRGRVFDFHALRATFITNLARAGVHPTLAQKLARHSDPKLTSAVYSLLDDIDLADGVNALPPPGSPARTPADTAATRELSEPVANYPSGEGPQQGEKGPKVAKKKGRS
jgi:integrase